MSDDTMNENEDQNMDDSAHNPCLAAHQAGHHKPTMSSRYRCAAPIMRSWTASHKGHGRAVSKRLMNACSFAAPV